MEKTLIPQDGNACNKKLLKSIPEDVLKIIMDEQESAQGRTERRISWTETLYKIVRQWKEEESAVKPSIVLQQGQPIH